MTSPAMKTAPATHVVIGAGDGAAARHDSRRTLLVEPEPERAADLARRHAGQDGVTVLPAAVAARDGEAELLVFNFPALSSLHAPAGLKDLMPGLRIVARPKVAVLSVAALLDRLGGPEAIERPLLLTLDAPGAERDILEGWKAAGALPVIDWLELRCTDAPMYEAAAGRDELQGWLEAEGFQLAAVDATDPDWPLLAFRPDAAARELAVLRDRLPGIEARLAEAEQAAEAAAGRIAALEAALAEAEAGAETARNDLAEREARLQTTAEALRELTGKANWRSRKIDELEAAAQKRDAAAKARQAEAEQAEAALTARLAALEARAESRAQRIAEMEAGAARQATELDTLRQSLRELTGKAEWRRKRIEELEAEARHLPAARADLTAALRVQTMMQADLQDLQARHREETRIRRQLEDLLRKLTPRLQEAAQQLQVLSLPAAAGAAPLPRLDSPVPPRAGKENGKEDRKGKAKDRDGDRGKDGKKSRKKEKKKSGDRGVRTLPGF